MTGRDRRAIALGLAILVPSLGWIYAVRPALAKMTALDDQIVSERATLARERAVILEATRNPARRRIADSAVAAVRSRVFTAANDVAAGATLVTYLGDVARRTHVWLANATTRPAAPAARAGPTPAASAAVALAAQAGARSSAAAGADGATGDGVRPLRVDITAESDFRGVLDFLQALEGGRKIVTVERLDIARTLRAGDEDRETLRMTATVVGYTLATTPAGVP